MQISRFFRIDTTTFPGQYLSVVELSSGKDDGVSEAEVANTVHGDRDSLDAVMFTRDRGDLLELEGLHRLIRTIRPPHLDVVARTTGENPEALDDLVGAGYIGHILFCFDGPLSVKQSEAIDVARAGDCAWSAQIQVGPSYVDAEMLREIAGRISGARSVRLVRAAPPSGGKPYRKSEMSALAKTLKGVAREVWVSRSG